MIRLTAHAKVNLYLEITGRRPDGYHTLSTLFQTISLGDELSFSHATTVSLTCSDPALPTDGRNLVMRAALRLRDALREERGAHIHLIKKVPMGAGLGGGSADAAATLKGLLTLWNRRMSGSAVRRLAIQLGADVPFFLKGGLSYATGIGEKLKGRKPLSKTWMVLIWPGFGVSTKDAYAKVVIPAKAGIHKFLWTPASAGVTSKMLYNRFEEFIFPDHPELPKLKSELLQAGATGALMSGSGSSIFGLVKSRTHGEEILSRMQKKYPHAWLVHTLSTM
jgi:4-diphosphocytidyl-2-C-methyl-D-erythritol kinase